MFKNRGNEAFTKNDFQGAIQFYMKAIQYDPAHEGAWNNMGLAYRSTKDFRSAIKCFDKAITINPNNERALANKEACEYEVNRAILGLTKKEKEKPYHEIPHRAVSNENSVRENGNEPPNYDQGRSVISKKAEPVNVQSHRTEISTVEEETAAIPTRNSYSETSQSYEKVDRTVNVMVPQKELYETKETVNPAIKEKQSEHQVVETAPILEKRSNEPKERVLREDLRSREPKKRPTENSSSYESSHKREVQGNIPPPPEMHRERKPETLVPRKETTGNKFIIEQRMGPLGLRPTTVIRTATENDYVNEYRKQRNGRLGYSSDRRNNISNFKENINEEDVPAPPPDYEGPVGEATMKDLYNQRSKGRPKEETLCPYCRNPISSSNRNIRCIECGSFFCATCEKDFRGTREKGQKAVCAKCYINEIKEKERERKEKEREKNNIKKLEEQRRLREKLEEERKLRDKLEEEKRKIMDEMEVEKRKIRDKLEEERREKVKLEEESRFREQLEREREKMREDLDKAKKELEKEYLLQHQLDERHRKDNWIYQGLKDSKELGDRNEDIKKSETSDRLWSSDETTIESLEVQPVLEASPDEDESVFDVLARRFETGEITSEEYELLIEEALEGD
jgi:hypothetical protein